LHHPLGPLTCDDAPNSVPTVSFDAVECLVQDQLLIRHDLDRQAGIGKCSNRRSPHASTMLFLCANNVCWRWVNVCWVLDVLALVVARCS
jgi:hypothetical protein